MKTERKNIKQFDCGGDDMIVALISKKRMYTISLPQKTSGQYWISDIDENGCTRRLTDVEGIQGQWFIHKSPLLSLFDDEGKEADTIALKNESRVINAVRRTDGAKLQLYVEPDSDGCQIYKKYCVKNDVRINIGRASDNQIVFNNKYASAHHACLIFKDGAWSVTDTQSSNGIFVNERRISASALKSGDIIYIMGLKIVVGAGFFAVNSPEGVTVSPEGASEMDIQEPDPSANNANELPEGERFYRSPRIYRSVVRGDIHVDAPPQLQKPEETPLALLLGPALTMGMTAVVMGGVAIINLLNEETELASALPTIIMSFSMLCGTLLWPMLAKRNEKKKKNEAETLRQKKYREYLDGVRNEIFALSETQKTILFENCPDIGSCKSRILNRERNLWERSAGQEDFLRLRLGLGDLPLFADIRFPEKRFSIEDDMLQNEIRRLAESPKTLSDAPVTCSLPKNPVVGIVGEKSSAEAFLKNLILQIAALHSYEDVKLVFILNETDQKEWDFARLLPYTWNKEADLRYFAADSDSVKTISLALERLILERKENLERQNDAAAPSPHYVIIAVDSEAAEQEGLFAKIQSSPKNSGFSCLTIAERLLDLPKECSMVIELGGESSSIYDRNDATGKRTAFKAEYDGTLDMRPIADILANITADSKDDKLTLPNMLTFLEMYGVGKTEHLNALTRWRENNPVHSLQAPVGIECGGNPFYLDLHEKAHGPHGLVAGMTGSGKSEFIITFILSMAVNYHPDEVSFILIDYKGGGLAGAFENSDAKLPHLAGTITNLDGSAVNRALISIQSELRRRQAVFNEAKRISGEGTIDIYKYQKMYRSGLVAEPVPHLFIVSDEFAELKAQQPDFMAQLISAARIGRSLGVHLILATQKPSGVVDDQIWSNSRFRICLKVQERADSMEMLKRPDAAELKETGRFYLQVGFNELFELGQSAWCGAPYIPAERAEKKRDDSVEVIDSLGRILIESKKRGSASRKCSSTQVVSIVGYLSELAKEENVSARQLWLPQIPEFIYLGSLKEKYGWSSGRFELEPAVGEYDDPFNQSQGLLTVPFSNGGNTLLYGVSGSGKTTFLNTMLVGLLSDYSAEQLNIYILDMGEETLCAFADAPQVGDVLLSTDSEKIQNLFKMLQNEITERKKLFADSDGSYESYCRTTGNSLPQIIVIIRNYAAFAEQFELLDEKLIQITRECCKYGIYFLITANAANTVRYRVSQNFANVYALQLNDNADFIGLFGGTGGVFPSKIKGRGIFKSTQVYEFQTAHFAENAEQQELRRFVRELSESSDSRAKPVPVLPKRVTAASFQPDFTADSLPVGVEKDSLRPCRWNVEQSVISLILSQNPSEMGATVQGISEQLSRICKAVTVLDGAEISGESEDMSYCYLRGSFAGSIDILFNEMVNRNNTYKTAVAAKEAPPEYETEYYVITGLQTIINSLSPEGKDKLSTLLEKAELSYNIRFILCGTAKEMTSFTMASWYKRHINENGGLWVGDGIADQYVLKVGKLTNSLYSEIPPHFGYIVKRGKPVLAKLIVGEQFEEETDE